MKGFVSLFKKPTVLFGLLILTFVASSIIVIALFMGQEAGNFVIQVESGNERKSIQITESLTNPTYDSRLETAGVTSITNTTYKRFSDRIETYVSTEGMAYDRETYVYSYTFYMVNNCGQSLDVKSTMYYSNVANNLDRAIRVMTIASSGNQQHCYQAQDEQEKDYGADYPSVTWFKDGGVSFEEDFLAFESGTNIKYTILIWLEGEDPDCNDSVRNGTIRFTLKLAIL